MYWKFVTMTVKPGEDLVALKVGIIVNYARSITYQLAQGLHCKRRMIRFQKLRRTEQTAFKMHHHAVDVRVFIHRQRSRDMYLL